MKKLLIASTIGLAFALAGGAAPAQDAKKGEEALKAEKCTEKCHAMDAKKKGPALKASGAKLKKEGKNVDAVVKALKDSHDDLKTNDADLKNISAYLLTL
jgi:cytochrome c551/c552